MINRKTLAYSSILLVALVITSVLLSRGIIQGAIGSSSVTLTLSADGQTDVDNDGDIDGVPLGATARLVGTILIGNSNEAIDEVTINFAPGATSTGGTLPTFKLRVQPTGATTTGNTITKFFFATSTTPTAPNEDGVLTGSITGTGKVKVTIDISIFSTLPSTIPSTLPGTLPFKGPDDTSSIRYTIDWTPDLCQTGTTSTPCLATSTIAGPYIVSFSVKQPSVTAVTKTAQVNYLAVTQVVLNVTSPTANQGFKASDLLDLDGDGLAQEIRIRGNVNDGGVESVTLGGTLASAPLVGSPVANPTGPFGLEIAGDVSAVVATGATALQWQTNEGDATTNSLWHVTDEKPGFLSDKPYAGTKAFYYGQDTDSSPTSEAFNFSTTDPTFGFFTPNSGKLVSTKFTVGSGSKLKLKTWFDTEFGTFYDRKKIKYCPGSTFDEAACVDIVQITDVTPPPVGGFGGFFGPPCFPPFCFGGPPAPAATEPGTVFDGDVIGFPGTKFVFVPNFFIDPATGKPKPVEIELDLIDLLGTSITIGDAARIVFDFDTIDGFANFGIGWYVDDVLVLGQKTLTGAGFPVERDPTFSGAYKPVEGKNTIKLTASRTLYRPIDVATSTASTTIIFYLDTIAPKDLTIDDPDLLTFSIPGGSGTTTQAFVTSGTTINLTGLFTEAQPDTLAIVRRTAATTSPVTKSTLLSRFAASTAKTLLTLKESSDEFDTTGATTLTDTAGPESLNSTTLSAAALAGATQIKVADASGFAEKDIIKIDVRSRKEYRQITDISGNTITVDSALSSSHLSGIDVVEQPVVKLASTTNFAADKMIRIDTGVNAEVRQITLIETATSSSIKVAIRSALTKSHADGSEVEGAEDRSYRNPTSAPLELESGFNLFTVTLTDKGGTATSTGVIVLRDNNPPSGVAAVATIISDGEAVVGDSYFLKVAASDPEGEVTSVTESATGGELAPIKSVEEILLVMHGLKTINPNTTHIRLATVAAGTPVGANTISLTLKDTAENESTITATLNVVSSRTNRNYFLFPGVNFVGLSLIPDDDNAATTDDPSLDRLMKQDISGAVSTAFKNGHTHVGHTTSGLVTLGDIVSKTSAFSGGASGVFLSHTAGPAADTLTNLAPFQGMIMRVLETDPNVATTTIDVFQKVAVSGFTAKQAVPIKMNIKGVFSQRTEVTPPEKQLVAGYNLVAPHVLKDTKFDFVFRGALIPDELAVSAITFERRVDAKPDAGKIGAEVFEGFVVGSLGDLLKPVASYWTFIVSGTPTITP